MTQPTVDVQSILLGDAEVLAINTSDRVRDRLLAVWDRIHEGDQKMIEKHWTKLSIMKSRLPLPMIICVDGQVDGQVDAPVDGKVGRGAFGATSCRGFLIRLDGKAIRLATEENTYKIDAVIAHELGHVFDYATDGVKDRGSYSTKTDKSSEAANARIEEFANNTATSWGFKLLPTKRTD